MCRRRPRRKCTESSSPRRGAPEALPATCRPVVVSAGRAGRTRAAISTSRERRRDLAARGLAPGLDTAGRSGAPNRAPPRARRGTQPVDVGVPWSRPDRTTGRPARRSSLPAPGRRSTIRSRAPVTAPGWSREYSRSHDEHFARDARRRASSSGRPRRRAPAARARPGGAPEAVAADDDRPIAEAREVESPGCAPARPARRQVEHLIEVAIVELPSHPTESVLRHITPRTAAGLKARPAAPCSLRGCRSR